MEVVPTYAPADGEVLVAPLAVGVCGTDLDIARRARPDHTAILGHEGVAQIVRVGNGVDHLAVGQRVVFNPVDPVDPDRILGHTIDGLLQEYRLVSRTELDRGLIVPFDVPLPYLCGVLVEPVATVLYGQSLVQRACDQGSIAVVGAGPIGMLHAVHAGYCGCHNVILIDIKGEQLEWAVGRGIVRRENALKVSRRLEHDVLERTGGSGVDAVYLCTPRSAARDALIRALTYIRPGGCIDLVVGFGDADEVSELGGVKLNAVRRGNTCGFPRDGHYLKCNVTAGKDVWITGHRGASGDHMKDAIALLLAKSSRYASVISHVAEFGAAISVLDVMTGGAWRPTYGGVRAKVTIDLTIASEESAKMPKECRQ
jgi:2-epi-valiolone-7-phosphate 1-reductase